MKLGINEPKKVAALGGLILVAGYLAYSNLSSPSSPAPVSSRQPAVAPDIPAVTGSKSSADTARVTPLRAPQSRGRNDEFHPVLRPKRPEDRIDTRNVDPTLRLDLLAKLQEVELSGSGRNLFKVAPPPVKPELKGPEPKVVPKPVEVAKPEPPKPPPGPPPPPPINLKYYGFSSAPGNPQKTAYFLDGEDILFAKEGETLKRRYRVVRIGVNSVVMEDTESKHQQTIQLVEEAG
jgi:hypothetical protein